ncbi:MAG: YicC/YloC family endoribonuclease [Thermodesulfobacteriota bacterium]
MIKSMTAYAAAERSSDAAAAFVEIRTVNSRHLDLTLRLPTLLQPLEERVKSMISDRIARGRVEVRVQIEDRSEAAIAFEVDQDKAAAYRDALRDLQTRFDLPGEVSLEMMAGAPGMIRLKESEADAEPVWAVTAEALSAALDDLESMREKEGAFMAEDFAARLAAIEADIDRIAAQSDGLLEHYRDRLSNRIGALTQGMVEIDPARIAQEAAFLADRSDISEEITRARSHAEQFRAMLSDGEPAGRKLNFLLQEFNREFNTMGSKTGSTDVSHIVVRLKSELEKIREQVQNVE